MKRGINMIDFSQFDRTINNSDFLQKLQEAQQQNVTIPNGEYLVSVDSMELTLSSTQKVMFKAQFNILDGEFANRKLFFNRVISGTKNDVNMISGLLSFLNDMGTGVDTTIKNPQSVYTDIDRIVKEVYAESNSFEYEVIYDSSAFNTVKIA